MTEIGLTIGRAFIQPFIYLFFLLIWLSGYLRMKKDRKTTGARVSPFFYETRHTWSISLIAGLLLSILAILSGFIFTVPFALLVGAVMLLVGLAGRFSWLSAGYALTIASLLLIVIQMYGEPYLPAFIMEYAQEIDVFFLPFLIGLLLLIEACHLWRIRSEDSFPEYIKSVRGKRIGQHRIKKITLIPILTLLPGGWIEPFADWWPLIPIGEQSYALILVPYLLGFEYVVKTSLPQTAGKWLGNRHLWLALVVLLLSAGSYYIDWVGYIALAVALFGKEVIYYFLRRQEKKQRMYFQPHEQHLLVLGILADTPAVDLGLVPGEQIIKVNDQNVSTEDEFYQVINQNRAYCKLSIKDLDGEIRFAQRALYDGDHYKLGILFVSQ
ncbi:PDZ domain-containing protein [Gracilibacillus phocaeensis]|uniref:PDZ domain-containing protein n=1 Tax=Gracilibacillus phocaeensis TaxID=2042304 RepID=UPI00082642D0|nr:PDZ domain-containing protein [Gracilibacillus phocaeensis]